MILGLKDRLKEIRQKTDLSQRVFSQEFGLVQQTYANYESGKALCSTELMTQLAEKYGINLHWLITGNGPMYLNTESGSENQTALAQNNADDDNIPVMMTNLKVSAGHGMKWGEGNLTGEIIKVPKRVARKYPGNSDFAAAAVSGDSMEPTLNDGEPAVFIRGYIQGDGIYVLAVHGELLVKRLEFNRILNKLRIISDNPKYPPTEIRMEDLGEVQILGKVVIWVHGEA